MKLANVETKSLEKLPPFDLEAERAVLGAILLDNEALFTTLNVCLPSDFYRDSHKTILEAMIQINHRGEGIDLIILRDELERANKLDAIGGPAYLVTLVDVVPTAANVAYHAKLVNEKARLRRLQNACLSLAYKIYDDSKTSSHEYLTALEEELAALRTEAEAPWALTSEGKPVAIKQREYVRHLEEIGFRATLFNRSLMFTQIEQGKIVKCVDWFKNVCFTLKSSLKEIYERDHPLLWELLLKEHKFDYKIMTSLAVVNQEDFLEDDATHCFLYFNNGCVEITPEKVTFVPYDKLTKYVWREAISPKDYCGIASPSPAYNYDADRNAGRISEFERFVKLVSDEVVEEHEIRNQEAFEHGMASLCWHHNNVLQQKSVVIIDNDPGYFSDGRRGKKILLDALRFIRSNMQPEGVVVKEDGKAFGGQFKFQRIRPNTKILIIDDVDDEKVNLKEFYSAITDGLVTEGKGLTRFAFTPETSPKLCFTTNKPFFGMDRSSADRILILPMTDYFTQPDQKPAQVFGHALYYDWDNAEWGRFQDYMICIIQEAMRRDPLHLPEPDLFVFNANRLMLEMPEALIAFFDEKQDDTDYDKDAVLGELKDRGFEFKKRGEFKTLLNTYCRLRGRELHKNTKDGRYIKNSVEYIRFESTLFRTDARNNKGTVRTKTPDKKLERVF